MYLNFCDRGKTLLGLSMIERVAPGVRDLSAQELEAVHHFTLLWTLFEAQVLGSNASSREIDETVRRLEEPTLDQISFHEQLRYFQNRYIDNGKTNDRFDHLRLRKNDKPALVQSVLVGENQDVKDQVVACLIIVYRFRNNFFHGLKWAYGLQNQRENFVHSVSLLISCLEVMPRTMQHI